MNKAFFLDRDGTLNIDYNYVHTPEEWTWCDGAIKALKWIRDRDFKIIIVTNQSGIAKEKYTREDVEYLHRWASAQLEEHNITIDEWYYAPYHPNFDSDSKYESEDRKPGLGMFKKAARKHDIDFSRSFMAGDKVSDMKPAIELGMTPLFIRSRHEPYQDKDWLHEHNISISDTLWHGLQKLDGKPWENSQST